MLYIRRVYTSLDLLSDLGGLYSSLSLLCLFLVQIFQFRGAYQYVMHDLFTDKDRDVFKPETSFKR